MKFLLLCDNLDAQCQREFKEAIHVLKILVWYGLRNATDLWQVVDTGVAQLLKVLTGLEHRNWLDGDNNADRWCNHEEPFTASERRILITHWAGEAWEKLISSKYEHLMGSCWTKTGCLMTADGSEDHLKPEGVKDYVVLPPSLLEPSTYAVASNEPPLGTSEADDDDMTEIAAEFDLSDGFIHQDA